MLLYKFSTKKATTTKQIDFGLLSDDEVRKMSVAEVTQLSIYHRGCPQANAINDTRMGTIDRRILCGSCGRGVKSCPGHCGHIECGLPIFHVAFLDHTLKVLRTVCYHCSHILFSEADCASLRKDIAPGKLFFGAIYNIARMKKKCPSCGGCQPCYTRVANSLRCEWSPEAEWEDEAEKERVTSRIWSSVEAHSILTNISDAHVEMMGLDPQNAHPRHTVRSTILVPPPCVRPAIMASTGSRIRGQDDLTCTLQNILKRAIELKNTLKEEDWTLLSPMTEPVLEKLLRLQVECFSLVNNTVRGQKQSVQRSGAPIKSIFCRLKGKDGRVRGNLMGKRVDFSARSVISPDAVQDVEQISVPYEIALELTKPIKVTSSNIAELHQRVLNGAKRIDGASTVVSADGQVTELAFCQDRQSIRLQPGWVVERPLQDGDWVIFNRQPSLWKFGMMAHRVKLVPGSTFRMNLCVAAPYNADFDGDEMNLHVCQSAMADVEVRSLMSVPLQTISPQANKPVMGIVQDALLGSALLTKQGTFLTKTAFFKYLSWIRYPATDVGAFPPPAVAWPVEMWTGSQLFSMLLSSNVSVSKGAARRGEMPASDAVLIRKGVLLYGVLTKSVLGTASNGIIDVMNRDCGPIVALRFMSDLQRVVNQWLMTQGFSVKVSDTIMAKQGHEKVAELLNTATENAYAILDADVPESMLGIAEGTIVNILSKLLMQTGAIARQYASPNNSIHTMVDVASKGNVINSAQISGCVGQQSVEGRRIFSEQGRRTLNCFSNEDRRLITNGFCQNSYSLGLQPEEFFMHSLGGREGLVDTAVKTAVTGYIQRRLIKMLEDAVICYKGTTRTSNHRIIEFAYGGDGCDASMLEKQSLSVLCMKDKEVRECMCSLPPSQVEQEELERTTDLLQRARRGRIGGTSRALDTTVLLPFNARRLIQRAQNTGTDLSAEFVRAEVKKIVDILLAGVRPRYNTALAVQFCFCSKQMRDGKVSHDHFATMMRQISTLCQECLIEPGECVGTVSAQSIGEPCTQVFAPARPVPMFCHWSDPPLSPVQMTLNSFHYSGVASKSNTVTGIPRLKEVLDCTKKCRTPSNLLFLKPPFCHSEQFAQDFARTLPLTKLSALVKRSQILADGDPMHREDETWTYLDGLFASPLPGSSKLVCRLTMNKDEMKLRGITLPHLREQLSFRLKGKAHVCSSDTNSLEWTIRIRLAHIQSMMEITNLESTDDLESTLVQRIVAALMEKLTVIGHENVVSAREKEVEVWNGTENVKLFAVETMGTFLADASLIPVVDWTMSSTTNAHEALELLGIEACAYIILQEIRNVVEFDGTYVDPRHIIEVANAMTFTGELRPVSRHGLNRPSIHGCSGTGPLGKCSFEETTEVLTDASIFSESDFSSGVTSSVMNGERAKLGTGCFDVLMPDWSLPSDASSLSSAPSKLAKSKIRNAVSFEEARDFEITDDSLFTFQGSASGTVESPFMQSVPADTSHAQGSNMACYADAAKSTRKFVFVPTSPKIVED